MNSDWQRVQVSDLEKEGILLVQDGNHGEYRPRPNEFGSGNTAFIRAADMAENRVLFDTAGRINDVAVERITKGKAEGGDVIFSHKGTVGKIAITPLDSPPFVCSPQTTFWRTLDTNKLDRKYLYCFMRSWEFSKQWVARKGETDMADYVSLTAQRNLHVILPSIAEQRAIGEILGTLDDKIELNRQMNHTLEAMAQAIFKSWFVDFDPVTAKAEGRQPYGMNAETAALFPSHFVESELGSIPEGWRASEIGKEVRVVGGGTPRTKRAEFWDGGKHCFVTPKDMSGLPSGVLLGSDRHITDLGVNAISSKQLPVGTVLLSSRAPIGYLAIASVPVSVNQGMIAMVCEGGLSNYFTLNWTHFNMDEVESRAGGTTFPEISKKSFRPIPCLVPIPELVQTFNNIVGPIYRKIENNLRESGALETIRDSLLPKLLSGEIRIKGAEKAAEAVA